MAERYYLTGANGQQMALRISSDSISKLKEFALPAGNNSYGVAYQIIEVLPDGSEQQVAYTNNNGWVEVRNG